MTATYTCIACAEPIPTGTAIIVGVSIAGYPDRLPTNIVSCRGCEDRSRDIVAKALEVQDRKAGGDTIRCHLGLS